MPESSGRTSSSRLLGASGAVVGRFTNSELAEGSPDGVFSPSVVGGLASDRPVCGPEVGPDWGPEVGTKGEPLGGLTSALALDGSSPKRVGMARPRQLNAIPADAKAKKLRQYAGIGIGLEFVMNVAFRSR